MVVFILQTLLLMAIAYILGCMLGCLLHQWFGAADEPSVAPAAGMAAAAAAPVVPASVAAPEPVAPPAPEPVALVDAPKSEPKPAVAKKPAAKKPATKAPAKPKAAPVAKVVAAPAQKDDLKRIRGIGRQNEARLNAIGVATFAQIAAWSKKEQEDIGERLAFPGRIEREEWVKQAKVLAKGGDTEFSKRVAKGEVSTSVGKGDVGDMGKKPKVLAKARGGKPDNLTLIDGVGNSIEKRLHELGIFHFDQIAAFTKDEATWVSIAVGFPGRAERENWVGDAKILAAGGTTAHAQRVESGEIATSRKSTNAEKGKKS